MSKATITPFFINNIGQKISQNIDILFEINNRTYSTKDKIDSIIIDFNELETEIGEKVCSYKINNKGIEYKGLVKIYPGNSDAYIFLNNQGITCEFIFLKEPKKMQNFLKSKFEVEYNFGGKTEIIPVNLNSLNTPDRANLILINCPTNIYFLRNNIPLFNLKKLSEQIHDFSEENSFVICFHNKDYLNVEYKKLRLNDQINFKDIYSNNNLNVDKIYQSINNILNMQNSINLNLQIENIYDKNLDEIISKKIVGPKKILEKEFDQENYFDFYYKLIFSSYLYKKRNSNNLNNLRGKLEQNYNLIKNDKDIKIYEKILLLKNIYIDETLEKEDLIKYIKINKIDHNTPLFLAIEFLKNLIKYLDYNTTFYYPLMSLDSGIFRILYKKVQIYELTTYGLNMYDIQTIKNHLNNLIPNLIIISDSMPIDDYCHTFDGVGLVMLNNKIFGNFLDKNINDKNMRDHYTFYLAINLFIEIFSHNKNFPFCFKDDIGLLRYLPYENNEDKFECLNNIRRDNLTKLMNQENIGDSGYFLEFFFGTIGNENVIDVIDEIKDKTNLGILLNVELWNKNISHLRQYIELKYEFIQKSLDQNQIDLNNDIFKQIDQMEDILSNGDNNIIIVESKKPSVCHLSRKKTFLTKKFNFFDEQNK